ncbi:sterol desaturase family protein [Niabella drilacis]|uniref:Sterol desaturase/sphingolipid hydroxylase, fatty acid hydroxylase superfamily n=1 Tax=Niabella drilacis (strain DSM 25811 / CCM 8410 / CCUG 62505 / LMG 26954 / E90) TaxID=1285928 RepID=A0A1G7B160_NIADE|nr:sterol desaturase family protein [Niabella drilacis]SDE20751.1 Sterol desaturase/sphingolipid hydroxylase, fatty acid hydroxylase superfamily [Niabella drilacis]
MHGFSYHEQLLLLFSTPFYVMIIGAELLLSNFHFHKKTYTVKDTFTNIYLTLANGSVDVAFKLSYLWVLIQVANHSVVQPISNPVVYWLLLLVLEDFVYYWLHRLDHTTRFLWAVHVTHHSSQKFNFSVGFRSSVFEPLYRFIFFIPLAWIGFQPVDILFMYSATQIWGTLVHTELVGKLGWLEEIFVTPSHHRVHHSSNPKYLDKNMGMFLIIWDKLFGTFQRELPENEYAPIQYGLTKNLENPNPFTLIFHEWIQVYKDVTQKGISTKQRLGYLFGPPGYSHDGSRKTSRQMEKEEEQARLSSK